MLSPLPGVSTAGDNSVDALERALVIELQARWAGGEEIDRTVTQAYGPELRPENREFARNHLKRILFHPKMARYAARLVEPVMSPTLTKGEMMTVMLEGMGSMQAKGIARLPANRQAQFVGHLVDMMKAIPAEACKSLLLGQLNTAQSANVERRYIASLPLKKFKTVTLLYGDAMEAELNGTYPVRNINDDQAALAAKALEKAFTKRLIAMRKPDLIERVSHDSTSAPASEVCAFYVEYFRAMLDLGEPYRTWQLSKYIGMIQ